MAGLFDDEVLAQRIAVALTPAFGIGIETAVVGIGADVAFDVSSAEAQRWLGRHSLTLAKGLNRTTTRNLRAALKEGVRLGEGRNEIATRLRSTWAVTTDRRARLIAQTETIAAYSNGSLETMKRAKKDGFPIMKKWISAPDADPLCSSIDGREVEVDDDFEPGVAAPPLHPGCRCSIRTVYK